MLQLFAPNAGGDEWAAGQATLNLLLQVRGTDHQTLRLCRIFELSV